MKRLTVALLCVLLATLSVEGQQETLRLRWGRNTLASIGTLRIDITSPVDTPTYTTTASTVTLAGTASDSSVALDTVTWSSSETTPTSGTCTGTGSWSCAGGTPTANFDDQFNSGSNVDLASHSPNIGTSWAEVIDTCTTTIQNNAGGYIRPAANCLDTHRLAYQATPSPAITGTNYDVQATALQLPSASDKTGGLLFRFAGASPTNYCSVLWYSSAAATDLVLGKRVAGVYSEIASSTTGINNGDVIKLQVRGSSLTVLVNGASRISTTDSFCDDAVGVGVIYGAERAADDITNTFWIDNFQVVDQDAAGSSITLAAGANTITVQVCNVTPTCATDTIVVTKAGADTTPPVISTLVPTSAPTLATSATSLTWSGTVTDNVSVASVSCACPECTPTSRTTTISGSDWTATGAFAFASGSNVVTCTATDGASNTAAFVTTVTFTPSDVTAPTVTITTNGGVNYSTSTTPQTIAGTCTDNVACTLVFCVNSATGDPGGTVATGTSNWTLTYSPTIGANTLTCHGRDLAQNDGTDAITVTFSTPVVVTTAQAMPTATVATAYTFTMASAGGTVPYTWTNNGAGTTLADADPQCAGLSISSAGVVSGTPTTNGTCSWTSKVTDSSGGSCPGSACDTETHTIVVQLAGTEGPHDDFDTWCARSDVYTRSFVLGGVTRTNVPACLSLRPLAGQTSINHPRWADQLLKNGIGYAKSSTTVPVWLTYDYAADTYANKQDAAKLRIPAFLAAGNLGAALDATQTTVTFTAATDASVYTAARGLKVDSEVMTVIPGTRVGNTVQVARGTVGTTAASHSNGAAVSRSNNSALDGILYPLNTPGTAATYLFIWDVYYTPSWADTLEAIPVKNFQLSSGGTTLSNGRFWYEPGISQYPISGVTPSDYSRLTNTGGSHVGMYRGRIYNGLCSNANWALTDSDDVGPNAVGGGPLKADATGSCPDSSNAHGDQVGKFSVFPDRWNRIFIKLQVVENDYDLISVYLNDEQRNTVTINEDLQVSLRTNADGIQQAIENSVYMWWVEFNSSSNAHNRPNEQDMVVYFRNFVMLENPPDIATIILNKPVGGPP